MQKDTSARFRLYPSRETGQYDCGCPIRTSAGLVDSLIGKIRAIFRDLGRGSEWNPMLGTGNPAAAEEVKRYLKAVKLEQSLSAVTPKTSKAFIF